jgi:hypothetical protein
VYTSTPYLDNASVGIYSERRLTHGDATIVFIPTGDEEMHDIAIFVENLGCILRGHVQDGAFVWVALPGVRCVVITSVAELAGVPLDSGTTVNQETNTRGENAKGHSPHSQRT